MDDSPVFRFQQYTPSTSTSSYVSIAHSHQRQRQQQQQAPPEATTTVSNNSGPWTAAEHARFLDALEKFGCGQSADVASVWHAITAAVATRSLADTQTHARDYYAQLQSVNARKRKEYLAMQQIDARWTREQDTQLESALARHAETSGSRGMSYSWRGIASRVQGKTPRDARERFQKLCYDVARIENGQHVMMHLARLPRRHHHNQQQHSPGHQHEPNSNSDADDDASSIDCVIPLTKQETQLLLRALDHVPVASQASPDALAAVASAVSALACVTSNRQPPQRAVALFTVDDAERALRRAIEDELVDPLDVLELLAVELRLVPQSPSPLVSTVPTTAMRHANHHDHDDHDRHRYSSFQSALPSPPSVSFCRDATTSFYQVSPSTTGTGPGTGFPPAHEEETQSAEELLTLRLSPVHAHHRDEMASAVRRYRRMDDLSSSGNSHGSGSGGGSGWPYSFLPVVSTPHNHATNSFNLETADHHHHHSRQQQQFPRGPSPHAFDDAMDDVM